MLQISQSCIEEGQRGRVVEAARGWLGTPYHIMGRIKGTGADCLTLLAGVYAEAGVIPAAAIPYYPQDWHLHRGEERYLAGVLAYAREVAAPLPGDIALWKFGRCFSHGAIVVEWPLIIHAYIGRACVMEDVARAEWLAFVGESSAQSRKPRPCRFFSPWQSL